MMFHYPYFPYYNRYTRYGYSYPGVNINHSFLKKPLSSFDSTNSRVKKEEPKEDTQIEKEKEDASPVFFNLFGIELHFDDILLICLIFFLYSEGVEDQSLFIALILLLLS